MNRTSNGSQQQAPVTRSASIDGQTPAPLHLHPEIRSLVQLINAHAHKIYFSGPLMRRFERQPDGQKPHKDEGWTEVWAQLGGTNLSIWDMKEIQEASKQGREVPPSYINVTDAVGSFLFTPFLCSLIRTFYSISSFRFWVLSRFPPRRPPPQNAIPTSLRLTPRGQTFSYSHVPRPPL